MESRRRGSPPWLARSGIGWPWPCTWLHTGPVYLSELSTHSRPWQRCHERKIAPDEGDNDDTRVFG